MRILLILILIFFSTTARADFPNYSEPDLTVEEMKNETKVRAQLINSHASSVLAKTRLALMGLGELISRNNLPAKELHELLRTTAAAVGNIRAIILISKDGIIQSDSTTYPENPIDLSARKYVREALKANRGELYIGDVVKGTQSGFNFIPLSMPIKFDGETIGVLAAVLTPEELLSRDIDAKCLLCMSVVTDTAGKPIIQYPNGNGIEQFTKTLPDAKRPSSGSALVEFGNNQAVATWITNTKFDIISVYLQFVR